MGAIAPVIQAVAGLATTAAATSTVVESRRAKARGRRATRRAEGEQARLVEEFTRQAAEEEREGEATRTRTRARRRQRARARGARGRRATILTGPLGIPGEVTATAGGKTLLGR